MFREPLPLKEGFYERAFIYSAWLVLLACAQLSNTWSACSVTIFLNAVGRCLCDYKSSDCRKRRTQIKMHTKELKSIYVYACCAFCKFYYKKTDKVCPLCKSDARHMRIYKMTEEMAEIKNKKH